MIRIYGKEACYEALRQCQTETGVSLLGLTFLVKSVDFCETFNPISQVANVDLVCVRNVAEQPK